MVCQSCLNRWVEKFEERRRQLGLTGNAEGGPDNRPTFLSLLLRIVLQVIQLTVVLGLLLLWPCALVPGGLDTARVWYLYLAYWIFFAMGSIGRIVRYGNLSSRKSDAQGQSLATTLSWVLFVISLPVIHWWVLRRFLTLQRTYFYSTYDVLGTLTITGAIALMWSASHHLGKAYDRVVTPDRLVTVGPYRYMQHPIYTSYMMLFTGFCLSLHSAPAAFLIVLICAAYYTSRTKLEEQLLSRAFGEQYEHYRARTKKYIPLVW